MKKILILKLDNIGDFALCLPWLRSLADSYQLEIVAGEWNRGWKDVCPWVHKWKFVSFRGYQINRKNPPNKWKTFFELFSFFPEFLLNQPDYAIDLRTVEEDWRGRLLCFLSQAKCRVGVLGKGKFFLNKRVKISSIHEFDRIGEIVRTVFPNCQPATCDLVNIKRNYIKNSQPKIVAHPGAGNPAKLWPESHWRELRNIVIKAIPACSWTWMGGPNDSATLKRLCQANDGFLQCKTIKEALQALSNFDLLVGLDSAAPHLAHLVSTPSVTLFSAANFSARWRAKGQNYLVEHHVPCSPCHSINCPIPNHPCMTQISPQDVLNAITQQLSIQF